MTELLKTVLRYLKQPTTVMGIITFLTGLFAVTISTELSGYIVQGVAAVAGGLLIWVDQDKGK